MVCSTTTGTFECPSFALATIFVPVGSALAKPLRPLEDRFSQDSVRHEHLPRERVALVRRRGRREGLRHDHDRLFGLTHGVIGAVREQDGISAHHPNGTEAGQIGQAKRQGCDLVVDAERRPERHRLQRGAQLLFA